MRILVVGAGFAGAVVARELAEAGHSIVVIDERNHIAGNAYDYTDANGIRVHKYGPHLWHTNNKEAHDWFSQFTDWVPYKHKVLALLGTGEYVPLPINRETINKTLGLNLQTAKEVEEYLEQVRVKHNPITNSREHIEASVGKELCDVFFAPYTMKMWGQPLEEMATSVASRIPTKLDDDAYYFPNDQYQALPADGYTAAFEKIFAHPNIYVSLNTPFEKGMQNNFDHIFNSMPIDVYELNMFGELPYRSIKFETVSLPIPSVQPVGTVNFTHNGPVTRVTEWKNYPAHGENAHNTTLTFECPCDYKDNDMQRFYPIKDVDGKFRKIYNQYANLYHENMTFIGRCGTYQYLDMWAVVMQTLKIVREFKEKHNE